MVVILPRKGYNVTVTPLGDGNDAGSVDTDGDDVPPRLPDPSQM